LVWDTGVSDTVFAWAAPPASSIAAAAARNMVFMGNSFLCFDGYCHRRWQETGRGKAEHPIEVLAAFNRRS
jgi:hypothetical protein